MQLYQPPTDRENLPPPRPPYRHIHEAEVRLAGGLPLEGVELTHLGERVTMPLAEEVALQRTRFRALPVARQREINERFASYFGLLPGTSK